MGRFLRGILIGTLMVCGAWGIPYEQVPNPRPARSYVSDGTNLLNASQEQTLNRAITDLERINGSEIAVVIVADCSGREVRDYAHRLFNYWGVGKRGVNNGLLFLVAMKERRMEVATGDGVRRFVSDADLKQMLEGEVVPQFRSGHPDQGVIRGVNWLCRGLTPARYETTPALSKLGQRIADPRRQGKLVADPDHLLKADALKNLQDLLVPLISSQDIQIVTVVVASCPNTSVKALSDELARAWNTQGHDGIFVVCKKPPGHHLTLSPELLARYPAPKQTQFHQQADQAIRNWQLGNTLKLLVTFLEHPLATPENPPPPPPAPAAPPSSPSGGFEWSTLSLTLAVASPFGLGYGIHAYFRYRKRRCPNCHGPMLRLDEQADDQYLSPGECAEERLGSVDYDIWLCPDCEVTQKGRYAAWFSGYSTCPRCDHRTLSKHSYTVVSATEYSEGTGRTEETCRHCSYKNSYDYTISRVQRSSDSSSSSSDSSYSSSSDSSSSWGGGSSSDGGAGASW